MNKVLENRLELFLKIIAVATVALVILGYISTYYYYSLLDIDISRYIEPPEVLLLFASNYFGLISFISTYVMAFAAAIYYREKSASKLFHPEYVKKDESPGVLDKLGKKEWFQKTLAILVALGSVAFYVWQLSLLNFYPVNFLKQFSGVEFFKASTEVMFIIFIPIILVIFQIVIWNVNKARMIPTIITIMFPVLLLASFIFHGHTKVTQTLIRYDIQNMELEFRDGSKIETNSSIVFLGSTRRYYFFRDLNSKKNRIIPAVDVKEENIIY